METISWKEIKKRALTLDLGQGWFHGEGLEVGSKVLHLQHICMAHIEIKLDRQMK